MEIKPSPHRAAPDARQISAVAAGLLAAVAASSCCILPLAFFGLGVSGAWIGNLTRLAPYQPCFIASSFGFVGYGYWLMRRSAAVPCADGEACERALPSRLLSAALLIAIVLVIAAVGFDFVVPRFLDS